MTETRTSAPARTLRPGDAIHTPCEFRATGSLVLEVESDDRDGIRVQTDNGFFHFSNEYQLDVTRG